MKGFSRQKEFSKLYHKITSNSDEANQGELENPFTYIAYQNYLLAKYPKSEGFKNNLVYLMEIKEHLEHAFNCFEVEFHLLPVGKAEYLNHNLNFVYEHYRKASEISPILTSQLIKTFGEFCKPPYSNLIDSHNRRRLLRWYELSEPIKSFTLNKLPEDKWLERHYRDTGHYGFKNSLISSETSFTTFKALFEGKYLENKIDWIGKKSSLIYFVKQLISNDLIENPRNKHWGIVSEFILINGEPIKQSELLNQKETTNKQKLRRIDSFITSLKQYNNS